MRPNQPSRKVIEKKQSHNLAIPSKAIPKRINLLFFVIFVLFLILLARLYQMQLLDSKFYAKKLERSGTVTQIISGNARGQIFDATGKPLVTNVPTQALTYTRGNQVSAENMRRIADKLVQIIPSSVESDALTTRDKKDYFLADPNNLKAIDDRIKPSQKLDKKGNMLDEASIYKLDVDAVTDAEINFSPAEELAAKLFKKMNGTATFDTTIIATGQLTPEQQAMIAEKERDFPGVAISTTWERHYEDTALTKLLGTVTTEKEGIPAELLDEYLKKGYKNNDRVGTAYIEKGYEDVLQGKHTVKEVAVDKDGNLEKEKTLEAGKKGDNLKLTIDENFQKGVEGILQNQLNALINEGYGAYANGAYAVVLNPTSGAIYAMAGIDRDIHTGAQTSDPLGTITKSYLPGSIVKPATISSGWENGIISGNQTLNDQPIEILGSNPKTSWFNSNSQVPITAAQALEYSSNTYMIQIALDMLGQPYQKDMIISDKNRVKVFDELRSTYGEYGLGVETGIDMPGEVQGIVPSTDSDNATIASLLDESFGQFDLYTPMQVAQYAATVANNGQRIAPHVVEGIYDSPTDDQLGNLVKTIDPKIMNTVDISQSDFDILHTGMYNVVYGGGFATGKDIGKHSSVSVSAKTGTSESYIADDAGNLVYVSVNNAIAFAPSTNPQIAIAVMVPNTIITDKGETSHANQYITADIVNLYNQMYGFKS